ncbi:MAG: sigma-54-dependent Fis family transcriptional regulator [Acidobacteria bacterium]|nr:sigma-54-dependent Fis family transcriptional regulator [Acidobacteriota bacterium]MBK8811159.1 sigma-54-dependent Fis family transcriptional regulator [Acidobacteriota bacterium]
MAKILIVDDEASMRRILSLILQEEGHEVVDAEGLTTALARLGEGSFDLVITDKKLVDGDGFGVLAACREADPSLPVVMLTAFGTIELAVEAMQSGAFDFVSKPFVAEVVKAVVRRATERVKLFRDNEILREEARRFAFADEILGDSDVIRELKERIARVAPTNATVLITGETGTGKELVARAIHRGSLRKDENFLAVNCAAVAEQLLESELFGHEKGSFTGADRTKQGLFEAAHRGTLFLDEAGEMSLNLQAKLLRVLTEGQLTRVGATTPRSVDVRIIVATHRDLLERVKRGEFREDLYYRLAVVPLVVPPLRDRREDIPTLVRYLLGTTSRELKVPEREISRAALDKLCRYDFPGNVRELRNLIERANILATGAEISAADFYLQAAGEPAPENGAVDLPRSVEAFERALIVNALESAKGVQAEAARRLGISRSDLAYKIKKHRL